MIFKELLEDVEIEEVLKYLFNTYKNEEKFEKGYRDTFDKLLKLDPITEDNDLLLFVVERKQTFGDEEEHFISVYGKSIEDNEHYALDFTPWNRWLGMTIVERSLNKYGKICFVAECLREMTFISFDEDKIQEEFDNLKAISERIDAGIEKTYSFEEILANLNDELGLDFKVTERTFEETEEDKKRIEAEIAYNAFKIKELFD